MGDDEKLLTFRPRSSQKERAPSVEAGGPIIRPREFQLAGRGGNNVDETSMHPPSSASITATQEPFYYKRGGSKVFDPPIVVGTRAFSSKAALTIYVRRLLWTTQRERGWTSQVQALLDLPADWEFRPLPARGGRAFHVRPVAGGRWFELATSDIVDNIISDHIDTHTPAGELA